MEDRRQEKSDDEMKFRDQTGTIGEKMTLVNFIIHY